MPAIAGLLVAYELNCMKRCVVHNVVQSTFPCLDTCVFVVDSFPVLGSDFGVMSHPDTTNNSYG